MPDSPRMELLGTVARLQVQRSRLKPGPRGLRTYDPSPLLPVDELEVGPRGAVGHTADGPVLDVHHADHPDSRNRRLANGLSLLPRAHADALRDRDAGAALAALQRARRTQPLIESLRAALHGGREVTTVSPLHRRRRRVLAGYAELAERADYAMRNTRVVARRAYAALLDGEPSVPDLPDVLGELACAVDRLAAEPGTDLSRLAVELGYCSPSHFSDRFRAAFGRPPSAHRGTQLSTIMEARRPATA